MISIDDELHYHPARLWLDARRTRRASFISHAHSDHLGAHDVSICTPETGRLTRQRLERSRTGAFVEHAYGEWFEHEGVGMQLVPAGHVLGSAQLLAEHDGVRFLYTGDFKLRAGRTHAPAEVPGCDVLLMECTFGRPHYRFPERAQVERRLVDLCSAAIERGATPIVYAYALGKAQEIVAALNAHGVPTMVHPAIAAICDVYTSAGVELGPYRRYRFIDRAGHALVAPPESRRSPMIDAIRDRIEIAVTGWACDQSARFRLSVDVTLPFSDHADFDELMAFVDRARPAKVYCVHGFSDFVHHLRRRGIDAQWLTPNPQLELFR